MTGKFVAPTGLMLILLIGSIFAVSISPLPNQWIVFAQTGDDSSDSLPLGSIERTNFDIPSLDFVLPDGDSASCDFRSIHFKSGSQTVYAYYDDYWLPEDKHTLKAGDTFTVDAYLSNPNTPSPSSIDITISKITSGAETGNYTEMKLASPINVTSSGNMYKVPDTEPGDYILDAFVHFPFSGVVLVYTTEIQVAP